MIQKKKTLQEEIERFKNINKYRLFEQEEELPPANPNDAAVVGDDVPPPVEGGDDTAMVPDAGMSGDMGDVPMENTAVDGGDMNSMDGEIPTDESEEIDITDLVNMTKSIKNQLDDREKEQRDDKTEIGNVFHKLDGFEQSLHKIDMLLSKIDGLEDEVKKMKEPTAVEKLEMRSLDSFPFNEKPNEFFERKQEEMRISGKNEYQLTKSDVENYSPQQITRSFNVNDTDAF